MSSVPPLAVAVIGAGAAGLCAARHVAGAHLGGQMKMTPTVFEQSSNVGGTWVYCDQRGEDQWGLPRHSSMYKNLRTNLPKEVMAFPDFPFSKQSDSFLHHTEVLRYLEQYAEANNLYQYIQFDTQVVSVCPVRDQQWSVTSLHLPTMKSNTGIYQSVIVCNGHYSVPVIPVIPGLDQYEGTMIHSHDYRTPEEFQGEIVLILGGGASGTDIAMEVCKEAAEVYLAHDNALLSSVLPSNVHQVAGVESCQGHNTFIMKDGSEVRATVLMFATGYHYTFPFLSPECEVQVKDRIVSPLYKHLVNTAHPTMAFIGIPVQICPFPQFDLQIRYFLKTLCGEVTLPSRQQMEDDTKAEAEYRNRVLGMPSKYFHKMGTLQWEYNRELARLGGFNPLPTIVEDLYMAVHKRRQQDLPGYKKNCYTLDGENTFTEKLFTGKS